MSVTQTQNKDTCHIYKQAAFCISPRLVPMKNDSDILGKHKEAANKARCTQTIRGIIGKVMTAASGRIHKINNIRQFEYLWLPKPAPIKFPFCRQRL